MASAKVKKLEELEKAMLLAQKEYQEALDDEKNKAIQQVMYVIRQFKLTAVDLELAPEQQAPKKAGSRAPAKPKYKNPNTGDVWTGRGVAPRWLSDLEANGAKRENFLIDPTATAKPRRQKAPAGV